MHYDRTAGAPSMAFSYAGPRPGMPCLAFLALGRSLANAQSNLQPGVIRWPDKDGQATHGSANSDAAAGDVACGTCKVETGLSGLGGRRDRELWQVWS